MNGLLIVDKPAGWTSHDVVGKLRRALGERRVGHGGTLDPMATGVLPVFVGRATRAVPFCENDQKEYVARFRPGIVTDTQDVTGTVLARSTRLPDRREILDVLPEFTGDILQIPPMYSAVKVQGKKLYELARKGMEVERKPRRITIYSLEAEGWDGTDAILRVKCSKGTYIRTLCHDIGRKLGCGGCLAELRRTAAGRFTLDDCLPLEQILAAAEQGRAEELLLPVDRLFDCPSVTVADTDRRRCLNGNPFSCPELKDGYYRVYDGEGSFLLLGNCVSGVMNTVKSFFETGERA
ncbi:MAG: tRNA pseudouridine(55) synthase TruB [Oscillospiraceae bacterium]|nr:tRNA pseudouridine(55) synthase TruB [Oscillospiraceae bacterium]